MRYMASVSAGLTGLLAAGPVAAQKPAVTVFAHVGVIPMDSQRVLTDQTVVIRGERIIAFGPAALIPVPADAERIDGHGKFLMPGLANMHRHIERKFQPADLLRELANGVTTIRVMRGIPQVLQLRQQVAQGTLLGPRLYTAGPYIHSGMTPQEAAQAIVEQHAAGYDFIKVYGVSSQDAFDSIVAAATRVGIPLAGHVPSTMKFERVLQAFASTEHLFGYMTYLVTASGRNGSTRDSVFANLPYVTDAALTATAAMIRETGSWICPTLPVRLAIITPRQHWELERNAIKALYRAGAGARFLLGSDGVVGDSYTLRELEAMVAAGLTPYEALETATRNVALFFGTLHSSGTVAVGKRADLILLAGNPLSDITHISTPVGVMLGGRWLSRHALDTSIAALQAQGP
jgi:imidazolonepropionase-like amidohydrolase